MIDPIYLDYNATTLLDPPVVDAMEPYLRDHFGNLSSDHVYGYRIGDRRDRRHCPRSHPQDMKKRPKPTEGRGSLMRGAEVAKETR